MVLPRMDSCRTMPRIPASVHPPIHFKDLYTLTDKVLTVMVVDDNPTMREVIGMQLRAGGYEVVEAADGLKAVEQVKRGCPDLIFMDINMPGMDGLAAARLIRDLKGICHMPIIALSAYGEGGSNRREALGAGCDEYVSKTVGIDDLPGIVKRHLGA